MNSENNIIQIKNVLSEYYNLLDDMYSKEINVVVLKGNTNLLHNIQLLIKKMKLKSYVVEYIYTTEDTLKIGERHSFNDKGELYEIIYLYENGEVERELNFYDDNSKLIRVESSNNTTRTYKYNNRGMCIEKNVKDGFFNIDRWSKYEYDDDGRCIREYNSMGEDIIYKYDKQGNRINTIFQIPNSKNLKINY